MTVEHEEGNMFDVEEETMRITEAVAEVDQVKEVHHQEGDQVGGDPNQAGKLQNE